MRAQSLLPIILLPFLTSAVAAQIQEPALQAMRDAWQTFESEQGPGWQVQWSKATGSPKAIYGRGLRLQAGRVEDLETARRLAQQVLEDRAGLLGRGGSEFVEIIGSKAARVWTFVYEQRFRGMPVIGGRADIRIHENGILAMFGSTAAQIPAGMNLNPRINADLAEFYSYRDLGISPSEPGPLQEQRPAGELVLWMDMNAAVASLPRLAWRIRVDEREAQVTVGSSFVDAQTGAILEYKNEVYQCHEHGEAHAHAEEPGSSTPLEEPRISLSTRWTPDRMGITGTITAWANTGLRPTDPLVNIPLARLRVVSGTTTVFTDEFGVFHIPGVDAAFLQIFITGEHVRQVTTAQGPRILIAQLVDSSSSADVQILTAGATEFQWTQTTVYWATDDINVWTRGLMQPNPPQLDVISRVTARVNIDDSCNAFYSANSINFYTTQGSCNTTAYSTVIYHEWGHGIDDAFGGISQVDGLSEGWGDIMAMYRTGQPLVGEQFRISGSPFLRSGLNTRTYPAGGGVHTQGQTFMGFAWDLRQNLIADLGQVAGQQRAEEIVINSIIGNASNQFDAVREIFLMDDDDGNLNNGTPNYDALKAAADKRNLPAPEILKIELFHDTLAATSQQLSPRLVSATLNPIEGSVGGAELVYDQGLGEQRRSMVLGSGDSEYLAVLPPVDSPATVDYFFEVLHSSGDVLRFPSQGAFQYGVGLEDQVYSTDFESGPDGWMSGFFQTANDWEQGPPIGRSGTSNGITWKDPSSAPSGNTVFGNDLSANGSYPSVTRNYLLSPIFDMSGRSGVTLRFKRWLTVEEAIFDQASIKLNNNTVWTNPLSGHLVDTKWVDFELPLPDADNNSVVQVSWTLDTDAGLELGGWNIDDVILSSFIAAPLPDLQLSMTPAQVDIGSSTSVAVKGSPNMPIVIALSDSPGPTVIPGIISLELGSLTFLRS
ncbi:MAG: hypothetical protein ACYTG5_11640, partial [Planctomycetota bacterium]